MSFPPTSESPLLHDYFAPCSHSKETRYFTFKSHTLTGADASAVECNDATVDWSYSSDTDDDCSLPSFDTADHCLRTTTNMNNTKELPTTVRLGCASSCASGASTRHSSFNLESEGYAHNLSGNMASPFTMSTGRVETNSNAPSRRNSLTAKPDGSYCTKHSCNNSSQNSSTVNSKESSPCASRRGSFQDTFHRQVEHDMLGGSQLVLLSKQAHVPHLQIHVEEKTADRMVAHSTAVLRTTRNGQTVLRRSYGEQTSPAPTGSTIRGAFSVMSKRSPGNHGAVASGDAYGARTHNLQRSGAASETMIDSIEALMDAQGTFTKPGFAKQTVGALMNSVKHHK